MARPKASVRETEDATIVAVGNIEVVVSAKHVTVKDRGRRVMRRSLDAPRIRRREDGITVRP